MGARSTSRRQGGGARNARLWVVWGLRDARRRWVQVVSIALLLALGVGMYSAMSSLARWRTQSADASFAALAMHTLRVSLPEGSFAKAGSLQGALQRALREAAAPGRASGGHASDSQTVGGPPGSAPAKPLLAGATERLVVPTQLDVHAAGRSIVVPGRLVGAPVSPQLGAAVDRLDTTEGRPLTAADEGRRVAQLDLHFAAYHHLPASGALTLAGGQALGYVGLAHQPEYFLVTAPGADFGAEASFAVLFAPLKTVQALTGRKGMVNQLVLRASPGVDVGVLEAKLSQALHRALGHTGFTFTRASQESDWRLIYRDAEGDQKTMNVFAFLLLGAAVLGAFNLVSRSVEAQRREIGIGMALGIRPRTLAVRPLLLGLQVSLLGVALGVPAGLGFDEWLRSIVASFFPLPVWRTPLQADVFVRGAALGLALPMLATALALRRALRATPVEAIRVGARAAKSSGLAWIVRGLRLPGGSLGNLPLRNVLRTPRRTAMTMLGVGAVVSIVIALSGAIDSFDATLSASRHEALAGANQRLTVDLNAPVARTGATVEAIERSPVVGRSQRSLRIAGSLSSAARPNGRHLEALIETVEPDGALWHPTLVEGSLRGGPQGARTPKLAISARAAKDLGVSVGDALAVRHPVPSPNGGYALATTRLTVGAIHSNPFRFVVYANRAAARAMGLGGLTSRLSVVPRKGFGEEAVKRALLHIPAIASVQGAASTTEAARERMDQFTEVLVVTVLIAMAMALLIAFNSAAINADERLREHATMFAYGVSAGRVLAGNMAEELIVGLLATAVGFAGGYGVLRWMVDSVMAKTLPDVGMLVALAPGTVVVAILAGTVVVALAPILTLRRLRRTDVPAALRVVE